MKRMEQQISGRKREHRFLMAALCLLLSAGTGMVRAQDPVDTTQTWTATGTAGWSKGTSKTVLSNPGGYLRLQFKSQYTPYFEADTLRATLAGGLLITNISFRFQAPGVAPSTIRLCFHSGRSGNLWYVSLSAPDTQDWITYNLPVNYDALRWIQGPRGSRKMFLQDIQSVNWVGVHIRRHGSVEVQNYGLDDFRIQGITIPSGVSLSGQVQYDGEQEGPIRVLASSVGGAFDTNVVVTLPAPGEYEFTGLPILTDYAIRAYGDSNTNRMQEFWEASGVWPENPEQVGVEDVAGVNFSLTDPKNPDGLAYWWLRKHFGLNDSDLDSGLIVSGSLADGDNDGDGMSNYAEYRAGSDPNDPDSKFQIGIEPEPETEAVGILLRWSSIPARTYSVRRTTSLLSEFLPIESGIPATPPFNMYRDVTATNAGPYFYRVEVEEP